MSAKLHISRPSEGVALIEIDSPPANALGHALRETFAATLDELEADLSVRALVLTGRGKGFCAGDDLREAMGRGDDTLSSLAQFGGLLDRLERLRAPVVAAVNGHAIGGGLELALCCDIRIASARASFQGAGVNVGLMASVRRLPRLIGIGPAKAMLLTGLPIDADTARAYGLVTAVHPPDQLMDEALALAARIASRAPLAVEASKRMIGQAFDLSPDEAVPKASQELRALAASNDHRAAIAAFVTRQEPRFSRS